MRPESATELCASESSVPSEQVIGGVFSESQNGRLLANGKDVLVGGETGGSTRRSFLQASAVGGVAMSSSLLSRTAFAGGTDTIRVGLIGCGGRGNGAAANAINADPSTVITSMGDMYEDRLNMAKSALGRQLKDRFQVKDDHGFHGWDAYQKVIESGVDVVILTAPPHFRAQHLEAAIQAGKHVFCEKPIATDMVGVRKVLELSELAKEKKLNLVSGLCWRYDLGVKATIEKIKEGAIGDIVAIQENYLTGTLWQRPRKEGWTDMHYQLANWLYFRWLSGDHINEQFIHSLDKSLWLHDDEPPVKCYGMGGRQCRTSPDFGDVYDHFYVVYEWANGTRTFAATRQMDGCFNETEDFVFGTKGTAKVLANEISGTTSWKYKYEGEGNQPSMYDLEHVALFKAIREGKPINNGTYMCYSTMLALMGREACYSGKVVTWEQCMNSPQDFTPDAYEFGPAPEVKVHQPGNYQFE